MSTFQFAQRHLARPLGMDLRPWIADPQGIYFGGNDMYLTPRDMLKIGRLYLDRGKWGDRQIIPEAWIDSSFTERTSSPWSRASRSAVPASVSRSTSRAPSSRESGQSWKV